MRCYSKSSNNRVLKSTHMYGCNELVLCMFFKRIYQCVSGAVVLSVFAFGTTNAKGCFDWAGIFSVASLIYLKNIIFYVLIYVALLKVINGICVSDFWNFLQCTV
jgi:hypothetical protein